MKRIYTSAILEHIESDKQMLFLMGPRQVGKTTTCQSMKKSFENFHYLTWDNVEDRELILKGPNAVAIRARLDRIQEGKSLIVFDEIHKFSQWKDFLKGFYDIYSEYTHIIVTGSARLDVYKKGGDSLMGRYFLCRFHPLSVGEIACQEFPATEIHNKPMHISDNHFEALWRFGGYPDPFLKASQRFFNKWNLLRFQQLFQEDIRDLTRVQELKQLEVLAQLLKLQIGMNVSYESLAKKVRVSSHTIRNWVETLSTLYYCFEVRPWSKNISRSLIKEPKIYLWDWSQIPDEGARAENFVASHLLKSVHFWTDAGFGKYELYYIRDKDQREVDFVVVRNDQPWFLVEVKKSENKGISPVLEYFQGQTGAQHAFQVVIDLPWVNKNCFAFNKPIMVPARTFLSQLI